MDCAMTHNRRTRAPSDAPVGRHAEDGTRPGTRARRPESAAASSDRDNADADNRTLDQQLNEAGQTEADAQGGSSLGVSDR